MVVDEIVYVQVAPIVVPAASTYTYNEWVQAEVPPGSGSYTFVPVDPPKVVYNTGDMAVTVRGMDRTRWERSLPLVFTTVASITANTAADGTGTNVPVSAGGQAAMYGFSNALTYLWMPQGSTGYLAFWNQSNVPVYVRVLTINGRPARTVSPFAVTVDDVEAQVDGVVEVKVRNAYLPTSDVATDRARDYLFFRSGMRARVDPKVDGCPYLHPLDAFAFVDDSVSPEVTEYLQVLRNDWSYGDDGYACALRTAPALPPTDRALTSEVVAPTDGAIAAADSGPWTWGGAHPLVWDWSEWA